MACLARPSAEGGPEKEQPGGLTTECVRDCAMEGARQTAPPQLGIGVGVGCGWRVEKGGSFDVVG